MAVTERQRAELAASALEAALPQPEQSAFRALLAADRDVTLRRTLGAGDAVSVFLSLVVALILGGRADAGQRLLWGLTAIPLMVVLFKLYGLYDRDVKRISHSTVDDLPSALHATLVGVLLLWLYAKVTPMQQFDLQEIVSFALLALLVTLSVRAGVRSLLGRLLGPEPALLIGGGKLAEMLVTKLRAHSEFRSDVIGLLTDESGVSESMFIVPVLGSVEQLERIAVEHGARRLIVSPGHAENQQQLEELLRRCRELNLKFSMLPKLSDMLGRTVEIDDVEGVTVFGVNPPWLPRSSRVLKRAMDFLIAGTLLALLVPLIAAIAIIVMLDSSGPAFFAQTRVGRDGRRFRLYKFRTMVVDAEQRRAELFAQSTDPDWLKLDHDPRITRLGRHLRRLSLDELPQLWNVLRGEMSMVGPRPLIEAEDERIEGWARGRLNLTPGITGYWQVLGRTRIPFEEMVKLDYLYVMNWSLWEDVRLMLKTLPAVVGGHGAN